MIICQTSSLGTFKESCSGGFMMIMNWNPTVWYYSFKNIFCQLERFNEVGILLEALEHLLKVSKFKISFNEVVSLDSEASFWWNCDNSLWWTNKLIDELISFTNSPNISSIQKQVRIDRRVKLEAKLNALKSSRHLSRIRRLRLGSDCN